MALVESTELADFVAGGDAGDADLLPEFQAAAESLVTDFCGRDFAGGTFTEAVPAGVRVVVLRNFPVATVVGVSVSGVPVEEFTLDAPRGIVTLARAAGGPVEVEYTTATGAVPPAVRQAVRDLVGHWLRQTRTAAATGQLNVLEVTAAAAEGGTGASTRYPWSQTAGFRLPPAVAQLLGPHRSPRI